MNIILLFLIYTINSQINNYSIDNGTLTINNDLMYCEYYFEEREKINTIIIKDGITKIGKNCFSTI